MKLVVSEKADMELAAMEALLRKFFVKHMEKLLAMPPRRHMKFDLPYNVEDVTRQARLVYETKEKTLFVIHCFATHKEYEKWYKSFK